MASKLLHVQKQHHSVKTMNIFWLVSSSSVPFFFGLIQYIPCNAFISPFGESRQVCVVVCECEGLAPTPTLGVRRAADNSNDAAGAAGVASAG